MNKIARSVLAGAAAGTGATFLMSAVMLAAKRTGLTGQLPPERIAAEGIEEVADRPADEDEEDALATAAHLGFGAGAGALFGLLTAGIGAARRAQPMAAGIGTLYATWVWLVSYQGWVPALRIMPPASLDRPGRVGTMIAAHWVYGAALGLLAAVLRARIGH